MLGHYDNGSFEINEAYRELRTLISLNTDIKTIVFTSEGGTPQNLTTYGGADVTVADIKGTGIYLVWFES